MTRHHLNPNRPLRQGLSAVTQIPPNFFTIPFGLAGLAALWRLMTDFYASPPAIADGLFIAAAAVWLLLIAGSLGRLLRAPRSVLGELRDPVLSPFWSLPAIVGMLLAVGLEPHAYAVARVAFVVFLVATILLGGWLTGQWITEALDQTKLHPGYFLPTVAGGLLGAQGAADFGMPGLGWLSFGIGMLCWLLLGSLILNRLLFTKTLPAPLLPTLAIELAPPAVGGSAYFALHGPTPNSFAYALAGYAVLMVLVQIRLLPVYARLKFGPGFWAFTFSWAAVAGLLLRWLAIEHPAGETLYAALTAGAVSLLIAVISTRSLLAVAGGSFLPKPVLPTRVAPRPLATSNGRAAGSRNGSRDGSLGRRVTAVNQPQSGDGPPDGAVIAAPHVRDVADTADNDVTPIDHATVYGGGA